MTDRTSYISGWNGQLVFGQLYHTPVSIMVFWACGLSDGDYIDLSDYFQEIYTVEATFNSNNARGVNDLNAVNVYISGSTVIMPYNTSGYSVNYVVFGHKAEASDGFQ